MNTKYNFDEEYVKTAPPIQWSQETGMIQQNISLFVEVMDSLKSDEDVKQNELLKEIYFGQFHSMQQKLHLLISNYQDNEEILSSLLDLHDWMEGVLAQYLSRVGGHNTQNTIQNEGQNNNNNNNNNHGGESGSESEYDNSHSWSESEEEIEDGADLRFMKQKKQFLKGLPTRRPLKHLNGDRDAKGKGKVPQQPIIEIDAKSINISIDPDTLITNNNISPSTTTTTISVPAPLVEIVHEPLDPAARPRGYRVAESEGECPICCEDSVPAEDLFIFDKCNHQYCRECLQGYYTNRIHEGKVLDITCPAPGCATIVEYHQVQAVVTREIFSKFEEFTFIASLNADPSVKWCPKPGCGNAIIGDPENPRCQCTNPDCKYEFCFLCSEPWHADATCEQYQHWKQENGLVDQKFTHWAKKNTKKCPQCKTIIEKMAGCNHMTCSNCKFEFCWLCGGKYSSNHFDVFNVLGCPGMQSGSKQFGVARRLGMRALIGTGMVLGGVIGAALAIPAVVVAGPIYGGYKLHQRRKRNNRRRKPWNSHY